MVDEAVVLKAIRERAWHRKVDKTKQAEAQKNQRGLTDDDIRRALITAKAARRERDGWRIAGGTDTQGRALEPLVAGNAGRVLVLEL